MTERRSHIQLDADLIGELPKRSIKFDATINLGHIITFIGFILAGFGAWSTLDKIIPDPQQAADAKFKVLELAQKGELAVLDADMRLAGFAIF